VEYLLPWASKRVPIVPDGVRSSVVDATPPAETENLVADDTWRSIRDPMKDELVFTPIKVPEGFPLKVDDPSMRSAVEVVCVGEPWRISLPPVAEVKFNVGNVPYPDAVMLVDETDVRKADAAWR
jgi:hypothetical protein